MNKREVNIGLLGWDAQKYENFDNILFFKQKKYLKDGDNSNFRSTPFKKYDHGGNDRIDAADSEVTGVSTP